MSQRPGFVGSTNPNAVSERRIRHRRIMSGADRRR
jgi:hypothetical protein